MVDVLGKRCLYRFCTKGPSFNLEGIKSSVYCKQHALGGMINVYHKHCSHPACTVVVVVVVLTLTRIIKSAVTGQAPVTPELRNTPGEKHIQTESGTPTSLYHS